MQLSWTEYHVLWTLLGEGVVVSTWALTVGVMFMAGITPTAVRRSRREPVRTATFALIMLVHMSGVVLALYAVKHPLRAMAYAGLAMVSVLVAFVLWAVIAKRPVRRP